MANNLHISYDLQEPGKNYSDVIAATKSLGSWAKIHYSYWYVKSEFTAAQAGAHLIKHIDKNDSLYVVDATNNTAYWYNISNEAAQFIHEKWYSRAA